MSRLVFVNGEYLPYEKSKVHIEDRGYQFADGVYEVFAVIDHKIADYDAHMSRLLRSLSELNIKLPYSRKSIFFHISNIVKQNLISNGLVYLQVSRGVASRDFKFPNNTKGSLVIIGRNTSLDQYYNAFDRGIKVSTTRDLRWKRVDIKSLNLLAPVLAKQDAYENNCEESWLIDDDNFITEGSSSNAWIYQDGTLITRPVSNSILNGITRTTLIRGLKKRKMKYKEAKFNLDDVKKSSEAFITSATQHVMPVVRVNNIKIGKGVPGPRALDFKAAYMESLKLTEL
ncbi:MAG: D-amino-acid transaminase [Pelagibacterales bacterium]|nr:D-amino-acid transaminase [Pelagibacterales bacterium]